MENKPKNTQPIEALTRPVKQFSVIWIVPIVALLAGLWMVYDTLSKRGPEITLTMANADGIDADKTIIKVLDVNIGKVTSVKLAPDNKSVILTARLNAGSENLLRNDTQLWTIKPRFDKGSVSGLSTLLSGSYIQLQPGKSDIKQDKFEVLPNPPVTALNVPGLRINLVSQGINALNIGDAVLYQGYPVGRVETVTLDPKKRCINYRLFIEQAYARLVTGNTRFWNSSGFQIKTGIDGIKFDSGTLESMLTGGIEFDIPSGLPMDAPVKNMASFTLYPDRDSINEYVDERHINYLALFSDSVRGLSVGAPVEYHGLRIGTVAAVPYSSAKHPTPNEFTTKFITVLLRFEPSRMEGFLGKQNQEAWKNKIDNAIRQGMSARLKSGSLVSGAVFVDVDFDSRHKGQKLAQMDGLSVIPTSSGVLAQMESKISALLDKLNGLPLENTVKNANDTLGNASKLMLDLRQSAKQLHLLLGNSDTQKLPAKLQQTLDSMQSTLNGLSPQAPAYKELEKTITNLNQLIREARPVVRTLNEKPNSLVFDRSIQDKQPKGIKP